MIILCDQLTVCMRALVAEETNPSPLPNVVSGTVSFFAPGFRHNTAASKHRDNRTVLQVQPMIWFGRGARSLSRAPFS